jgi:ATP-dependent Clp protease protease subunit
LEGNPVAKNWYSITARASSADIYILDEIGAFGVTAKTFIQDLRALGSKAVTLHVNSPGGDMFEAFAIFNALDGHAGHVTAVIEGVAASAASYIIMAAERIVMPANAMVMIHDPASWSAGGADDHRIAATVLENVRMSMVAAYVAGTGLSEERVTALMAAETWMTADEALALGFADEVRAAVKVAASFDLSRFAKAPSPVAPTKTLAQVSASYWRAQGKGRR